MEHGSTLVFTGDSITDCGRVRPVGEKAGLGEGYASLVEALLGSRDPGRSIRILNTAQPRRSAVTASIPTGRAT